MNEHVTKEVANNWGALESMLTSVTGVLGSMGLMWWRQTQLEKRQDSQGKDEKQLSEKVHGLEIKIKESALTASTVAMNSMGSSLKLIAESNARLAETATNQTKLLDKMERSIDTVFSQLRTVEKEYVSNQTFDTFKENCNRLHER